MKRVQDNIEVLWSNVDVNENHCKNCTVIIIIKCYQFYSKINSKINSKSNMKILSECKECKCLYIYYCRFDKTHNHSRSNTKYCKYCKKCNCDPYKHRCYCGQLYSEDINSLLCGKCTSTKIIKVTHCIDCNEFHSDNDQCSNCEYCKKEVHLQQCEEYNCIICKYVKKMNSIARLNRLIKFWKS